MRTRLAAVLAFVATIATAPAGAQAPAPAPRPAPAPAAAAVAADPTSDIDALRAAVRADKRALVAKTLALTPEEAKKFWPIYDNYQRFVSRSNNAVASAIEDVVARDKPMSDPLAKQIVKEMYLADKTELDARKTMQDRVMRVLPPKKAIRYLQLESKIRAMQDYDIAKGIPLVK
jgi:Spy/CpxP family protein refolding chaperone